MSESLSNSPKYSAPLKHTRLVGMFKNSGGSSFIGNPSSAGEQLGGLEPTSGVLLLDDMSTVPGPKNALVCAICGEFQSLQRDHNRITGMIRGLVCRLCNSFLWVYETKSTHPKRGINSKRFQEWVKTYEVKIKLHLSSNTGVMYEKG